MLKFDTKDMEKLFLQLKNILKNLLLEKNSD